MVLEVVLNIDADYMNSLFFSPFFRNSRRSVPVKEGSLWAENELNVVDLMLASLPVPGLHSFTNELSPSGFFVLILIGILSFELIEAGETSIIRSESENGIDTQVELATSVLECGCLIAGPKLERCTDYLPASFILEEAGSSSHLFEPCSLKCPFGKDVEESANYPAGLISASSSSRALSFKGHC